MRWISAALCHFFRNNHSAQIDILDCIIGNALCNLRFFQLIHFHCLTVDAESTFNWGLSVLENEDTIDQLPFRRRFMKYWTPEHVKTSIFIVGDRPTLFGFVIVNLFQKRFFEEIGLETIRPLKLNHFFQSYIYQLFGSSTEFFHMSESRNAAPRIDLVNALVQLRVVSVSVSSELKSIAFIHFPWISSVFPGHFFKFLVFSRSVYTLIKCMNFFGNYGSIWIIWDLS